MVKNKIMNKVVKVVDLKESALSPVIPEKANGKEKPKPETPAKPAEQPKPVFPAEEKLNKWGFIHLNHRVIEAMGLEKGVDHPVKILGYKDGVLTIGLEL